MAQVSLQHVQMTLQLSRFCNKHPVFSAHTGQTQCDVKLFYFLFSYMY